MPKSICYSRLSSTDFDINNVQIQNLMDFRNQTNTNDRYLNNVNYIRNVLRKFFGGYSKKSPSINGTIFDDILSDQSSTTSNMNDSFIPLILIHFEDRCENVALIKQIIPQCCTWLIALDVLRIGNNLDIDLFQVCEECFVLEKHFC